MLKHLPPDKAAGPDGITNRILQASGEQAIDMTYLYMLIIWEVETYPGAWASALMQPLQFPLITSIDDLNWIGAFLYVDDMVLIARSPSQLQSMIDACQDWAERSRMRINHEKTEVMMFYETPSQRTTRFPSTFHISTRFPLSQPPQTLPLKEPPTFKYLGLTLDPYLTMEAATKHMPKNQCSTSNSHSCCPQPAI